MTMARIILTYLCFSLTLCYAEDKSQEHEMIMQLQQSFSNLENKFKQSMHKLEDVEDEFKQYRAKSVAEIQSLKQEVLNKNRNSKPAIEAENSIAFQAYMSVDALYIPGQVLIFDQVQLNYGEAYDPSTSKFRCPVTGLYVFSTTGMNQSDDELCMQIQVEDDEGLNKRNESASFGNDGHAHAQTVSAVVLCNAGHRVYVVNAWGQSSEVWATAVGTISSHQQTVYQTSFKGFFLSLV